MTPQYISTKEAAQYLKMSISSLTKWRAIKGAGPKFYKIGKSVRYRIADLDTFTARHLSRN